MAKETITRSQLAALPVLEQREAARTHEIVNDAEALPVKAASLDATKQISRDAFDKLSVFEKHALVKKGMQIIDTVG